MTRIIITNKSDNSIIRYIECQDEEHAQYIKSQMETREMNSDKTITVELCEDKAIMEQAAMMEDYFAMQQDIYEKDINSAS